MARVQTTVKQTAEKKIRYRFVCENCGHETDWTDAKITAAAQSTYKGYVRSADSRVQNNSQLNTKTFDNLSTAVQGIEDRLKKGKIIGGIFLKYKCSKCRKKQSWSGASSQNWMTVTMTLLFLCIGIGWAVVNVIKNPHVNILSIIAPLFICLIPLFIGGAVATHFAEKRRKVIMQSGIKRLEVDWLDGKPPVKY